MLAAFDRLKEALQGKRLKAARKFVNTCNGGPKLCSAEKRTHFDRKTPANFRKSPAKTRKLPQIRKSRGFDDQGIPCGSLARWQVLRGEFT